MLEALGFERGKSECGKSWNGSTRSGHSFAAPLGALELIHGKQSTEGADKIPLLDTSGEIYIEVSSLDSIYHHIESWFQASPSGGLAVLGEITETADEFRRFSAMPIPGFFVTFWEWSHPLKGKPLAIEGDLSAEGMRFAIVVARWNAVITERLLQGALDALYRSGAKKLDVEILRVPGAWEIPSAARRIAETGDVDAIITLGVLLRGETAHYEAIYNEVSRGIGQSQQETGVPHAFGVLTCETLEQALDRAGLKAGNKGFESACAAIEMVSLHRKIDSPITGIRPPRRY
ncbi:MAG TPA: 6,7-dimethyl-8-ribityllumazine synthase [Acidobacteriaceae bacterium]|nr:6,7-dimethyl-8-ribityllumazine synthase [Acidobacteriaceae bacterium]